MYKIIYKAVSCLFIFCIMFICGQIAAQSNFEIGEEIFNGLAHTQSKYSNVSIVKCQTGATERKFGSVIKSPDVFFTKDENIESEIIFESLVSDEDVELIAIITMAEAEGESEYGKRLVIDTILNRMDSKDFPNTAYDVIYQPAQFSSMWNGRIDKCYVTESICDLVRDELSNRTNYDVIFFTAGKYGNYGTPLFQVGNHFFSSAERKENVL